MAMESDIGIYQLALEPNQSSTLITNSYDTGESWDQGTTELHLFKQYYREVGLVTKSSQILRSVYEFFIQSY